MPLNQYDFELPLQISNCFNHKKYEMLHIFTIKVIKTIHASQRCIQDPCKKLRWRALQQKLKAKNHNSKSYPP